MWEKSPRSSMHDCQQGNWFALGFVAPRLLGRPGRQAGKNALGSTRACPFRCQATLQYAPARSGGNPISRNGDQIPSDPWRFLAEVQALPARLPRAKANSARQLGVLQRSSLSAICEALSAPEVACHVRASFRSSYSRDPGRACKPLRPSVALGRCFSMSIPRRTRHGSVQPPGTDADRPDFLTGSAQRREKPYGQGKGRPGHEACLQVLPSWAISTAGRPPDW